MFASRRLRRCSCGGRPKRRLACLGVILREESWCAPLEGTRARGRSEPLGTIAGDGGKKLWRKEEAAGITVEAVYAGTATVHGETQSRHERQSFLTGHAWAESRPGDGGRASSRYRRHIYTADRVYKKGL